MRQDQAYLIALRQRAYLQAMLLSQQLVLHEDEPAFGLSQPNIAYRSDYDEHVRRRTFCHRCRQSVDYHHDFNSHVREWKQQQASRAWEKQRHAQLGAWDRSFEELADDFYPDEVFGDVFQVIEPSITVSDKFDRFYDARLKVNHVSLR